MIGLSTSPKRRYGVLGGFVSFGFVTARLLPSLAAGRRMVPVPDQISCRRQETGRWAVPLAALLALLTLL